MKTLRQDCQGFPIYIYARRYSFVKVRYDSVLNLSKKLLETWRGSRITNLPLTLSLYLTVFDTLSLSLSLSFSLALSLFRCLCFVSTFLFLLFYFFHRAFCALHLCPIRGATMDVLDAPCPSPWIYNRLPQKENK